MTARVSGFDENEEGVHFGKKKLQSKPFNHIVPTFCSSFVELLHPRHLPHQNGQNYEANRTECEIEMSNRTEDAHLYITVSSIWSSSACERKINRLTLKVLTKSTLLLEITMWSIFDLEYHHMFI